MKLILYYLGAFYAGRARIKRTIEVKRSLSLNIKIAFKNLHFYKKNGEKTFGASFSDISCM